MGEVWKNHLISLCRGNCDYAPAGFTAVSDADREGDVRRKHEAPDSLVTHGTRNGSQAGSWLLNQDSRWATGLFQRRGKQDRIPCCGLTGASGRAAPAEGGGATEEMRSTGLLPEVQCLSSPPRAHRLRGHESGPGPAHSALPAGRAFGIAGSRVWGGGALGVQGWLSPRGSPVQRAPIPVLSGGALWCGAECR